jgi:hypothetical protein
VAEDEDSIQYFRRWGRRDYLRKHANQRRAAARAEGARRIDVTLRGKALRDYATVRRYIEDLNRIASERKILGWPIRLSDTEIINVALDRAASAICEGTIIKPPKPGLRTDGRRADPTPAPVSSRRSKGATDGQI